MRGQITIDLLVAAIVFIIFALMLLNLIDVLGNNFKEFSSYAEMNSTATRTVAILNSLELISKSGNVSYSFIPSKLENCSINVTNNNTTIILQQNNSPLTLTIPIGSTKHLSNVSCNSEVSS